MQKKLKNLDNYLNLKFATLYNPLNKISLKYLKTFEKIITPVEVSKADILVVFGGDGELLQNLHKYMELNIPFLGINTGSVGFLMNNIKINSLNKIINGISYLKKITLFPVEMIAHDYQDKIHQALGFNDVSIFRNTNQTVHVKIKINNITRIERLIADGALISTAAGSSAYNFSAGGNIIPIDSKLLCLTSICPYRPRRWKGAILPQSSQIEFEILDFNSRPANAVADFLEFKNIKKIFIKSKKEVSIKLLFTSNNNLENRMIQEQFQF